MKFIYGILVFVSMVNYSFSASFGINAEYSFGLGIPIPNIEDKAYTTFSDGLDISSEAECLKELNDETLSKFALAQAMKAGATDVILKCTKYWSSEKCDSTYPGCINRADIGNAKHLHLYNSKSNTPDYLRLKSGAYVALQSIVYSGDEDGDGNLDITLVSQAMFDSELWSRVTGENLNCKDTIENPNFTSIIYSQMFSDRETMALRLVCYDVNKEGYSSQAGENILRRKGN